MRIGRVLTAGTMAMGAYRAYRHYKGTSTAPAGRGGTQQPTSGGLGGLLKRR